MTVEIFALCDAATVNGGKLNILGAFDSAYAPQAPGIHAHCALALRLRFARAEEGERRIQMNIIDADGRPIMPSLNGALSIVFNSDDESLVANFIVNIQQLKLEKFGAYSIDLAVDDRHQASIPLFFKPLASPPPAPPPAV